MAIHWNVSKCDQAHVWRKDEAGESMDGGNMVMREIPKALIFTSITIGMNEITETNISEWCWRINLYGVVRGHLFTEEISEEFLRPFIGLNTNAGKMTRKQFVKEVMKRLERAHDERERNRREEELNEREALRDRDPGAPTMYEQDRECEAEHEARLLDRD